MRHLVHVMPIVAPRPARGMQYQPGCDCGWCGSAYVTQDEGDHRRRRPCQAGHHGRTGTVNHLTDDERAQLGLPPRHRPPDEGQWSRDDLAALVAEGRHADIETARQRGQLAQILTGETS